MRHGALIEHIVSLCPGIPPETAAEHVERLGPRYTGTFSPAEMAHHVRDVSSLTPGGPVVLHAEETPAGRVRCTVCAFDHPGLFSLITGILTGGGFNILSGDIFTYRRRPPAGRRYTLRTSIIDSFQGTLDTSLSFTSWFQACREKVTEVVGLLERGDDESAVRARQVVNEMVADRLASLDLDTHRILLPVEIEVEDDAGPFTRLRVTSTDSPGFLYALSTAFALKGIVIERVEIRTRGTRIVDEFDLVDARRRRIEDPVLLDQVKLSVLLTKQFTYFLGGSPDPYTALSRFERLAAELIALPEQGKWVEMLSRPAMMQELARLLGASDFLWEDFIRLHHETLLPMIAPHLEDHRYAGPVETLPERLEEEIAPARTFEETRERLNRFKDREAFLIEVDHVLNPDSDFSVFGRRLTRLAETVIRRTADIVFRRMAARHGPPLAVAGCEARFALCGLGTFGGAALGFGSDIELLCVYSDGGTTGGPRRITNAEFFSLLVKEIKNFISSRPHGLFNIDLRLRPYGKDGPLAASLAAFCDYYAPGGGAHSSERLALVRLRAVAGDAEFGSQVERIRDDLVYESPAVDVEEIRALRRRQLRVKTGHGAMDAKFSPGALVDLEYDVQLLQVMFGKDHPELRTPALDEALAALARTKLVDGKEADRLREAYTFFRRMINALRMLRGSAEDTFLPPPDSEEYVHLARRMGYPTSRGSGSRRLSVDFEVYTAYVRTFMENHFGREIVPAHPAGNAADVILSRELPVPARLSILRKAGFTDPGRALSNLERLAGEGDTREVFARLAILATDIMRRGPDPDMALNNWERFVRTLECPPEHYRLLLDQPRRAEILFTIFSTSRFLSDTLIRNPEYGEILTDPEKMIEAYPRESIEREIRGAVSGRDGGGRWINVLRRIKRRETLRIGTRDLCLKKPIREITGDLSDLADACIGGSLARIMEEEPGPVATDPGESGFCLLALGKLGGRELNYSSDIDLAAVYDAGRVAGPPQDSLPYFHRLVERLAGALSSHTEKGFVYRVDFRLRPHGISGPLVNSLDTFLRYYAERASLCEIQALLKLRPVAGDIRAGRKVAGGVRDILSRPYPPGDVVASIESTRRRTPAGDGPPEERLDVKTGRGGLRDVEFLVQGLQLIHAHAAPGILTGNTIEALDRLGTRGFVPEDRTRTLTEDYIFLRRVEHLLQVMDDRRIHSLPPGPEQRAALGKRILGAAATEREFMETLTACMTRIHAAYREFTEEYGS